MKKKYLLLLVTSLCLVGCDEPPFVVTTDFNFKDDNVKIVDSLENVSNKKAHIVFLHGQSNADGCSRISYLEKKAKEKFNEYTTGYDNVYINFFNDGGNNSSKYAFQKCTLGCGANEELFGPEMGIAEEMSKAYQDEMTFIIKWTWGGTTLRYQWLDNHHNRGTLYNSAMDFNIKCLDYLMQKGYTLSLDGICWMQGESDAYNNDWRAYYRDTDAYVAQLRHDLVSYQKDIKFIDATINDDDWMWPYPKAINYAKQEYEKRSNLNYLIYTNELNIRTRTEPEENPDYAHYDSVDMVKLGQEFGKIAASK